MTTRPMDTNQAAAPVDEKPEPNAELRAYADRVKAENASLRQQVLQSHLNAIGLQSDQGLGKAIAKDYDGDFTVDAVREYAQSEYGYEPPTSASEAVAQQQIQAQERVDQLQSESAPVVPKSQLDKIAEHDQTLAQPEATRADAIASLSDKLDYYMQNFR